MQIGLIIYGSLETVSGGYLYDRQLVNYLETQGDQVEVITIPWRNYSQHLMDNLSRSIYHRLVNLPVDILLQDELNHPSLFLQNHRLKKNTNFPIISIVHHLRCSEFHPSWQKQLYSAVERHYLKSVDGFIFNSQNTRQNVEKLAGKTKRSVVAYPAGDRLQPELEPGLIESRALEGGPMRILFLGNVIPRKGLQILLNAFALIPQDTWNLSVVGSMEIDVGYAKKIKQSIQYYGFNDRVKFYGSIVEEELKSVMLNSHIMVMPSYHEGFGIAYLEGMGFGLPAIASTAGGASEIITHGVNGFLVPQENAASLSEYISKLIDDRYLLIEMSDAALETYRRHPSWENSTARIRSFLQQLVDQEVFL